MSMSERERWLESAASLSDNPVPMSHDFIMGGLSDCPNPEGEHCFVGYRDHAREVWVYQHGNNPEATLTLPDTEFVSGRDRDREVLRWLLLVHEYERRKMEP